MLKYNLLGFTKHSIRNVRKTTMNFSEIFSICSFGTETELTTTGKHQEKQDTSKIAFQRFTSAQRQTILDIVNQNNAEQILSYDIAKTRAAKLLAWKKRNGPLKSIEDILFIDGFGPKNIEKFYKSMFEEYRGDAKVKRTPRQRTAGFVTPVIDAEHRQEIRSCVSLRVGVSSVTWARLELPEKESAYVPCILTDWHHHEITEKKLHLGDLVKRILYVDHLIPNANVYLFEDPPMAQMNSNPGSIDQQNVNIQKSQVIATLAYALCKRSRSAEEMGNEQAAIGKVCKNSNDIRPNVFYLRRFLAARLFSQLVGTERVSSEETILQLMRTHYNVYQLGDDSVNGYCDSEEQVEKVGEQQLLIRGNVQFSLAQREMFSRAERYHREFLGQALLLNLAFVRLLLLQDERSIAAVTRHQNKAVNEGQLS